MFDDTVSNSFCESHPQKGRELIEHSQIAQSNFPYSVLNGLRVLVVDDKADNLYVVEIIFEEYQAQVKTAASVDEAIEVISS